MKIGDRVKYVGDRWDDCERNPLWGGKHGKIAGTIISDATGLDWKVGWDNGRYNSYDEEDLQLIKDTMYKKGDVLVGENGEKRKVLGVCGDVHFLSYTIDLDKYDEGYTKQDLDDFDFKLEGDEASEAIKTLERLGKIKDGKIIEE